MSHPGSAGNVLAAICNVFLAGLGQLVQGRILAAIIFFILVNLFYSLAWFLFIPIVIAVPLHIWCIVNAALHRN